MTFPTSIEYFKATLINCLEALLIAKLLISKMQVTSQQRTTLHTPMQIGQYDEP